MKNKSFTLIELLVVIVIIGILAGVIMISTSSSIDKANIAKLKIFEESVANDLAANMVSRWKLDEGFGAATSDAWSSNTGTLSGFINTTAGYGDSNTSGWMSEPNCISKACLKFDGVDDYVNLPGDSNLDIDKKSFTLSVWINPLTIVGDHAAMGKTGYHFVLGTSTSNFLFGVYDSTNVAKYLFVSGVKVNTWYNVVGIYNKTFGKLYLYVDGIYRGNMDILNGLYNYAAQTYLGSAYPSMYPYWYNGLLDDVRVYNEALPISQIKKNYIAGLDSLFVKGNISKEDYNQRINALAYDN